MSEALCAGCGGTLTDEQIARSADVGWDPPCCSAGCAAEAWELADGRPERTRPQHEQDTA